MLAKVIGISQVESPSATLYDPTCGSGSLLLKAADETPSGVTIYGQDMDNATRALAKMNMILHDNPSADIAQGNSLASPEFKDDNGRLARLISLSPIRRSPPKPGAAASIRPATSIRASKDSACRLPKTAITRSSCMSCVL